MGESRAIVRLNLLVKKVSDLRCFAVWESLQSRASEASTPACCHRYPIAGFVARRQKLPSNSMTRESAEEYRSVSSKRS